MNPIQNNLNKYFNKNSARVISYGMKLRYRDKRHSNSGQAMMIAVMFFLAGSLIVLGGATSPVLKDVKISRDIEKSKQSIYLSESGLEDVVYRVKNNMNFSNTESLVIGDITATTTIAVVGDKREIVSAGYKDNVVRTTKAIISEGNNTSFDYVLQSAAGGIEINDEAYVSGDVFSDTAIEGEFSNTITGNAISAGPSGLIRNIHITGSGYANTIASSTIDGNAYYQSIFGTSVGGTSYPGSPDQALGTMPISDSSIEDMETNAQNGGVINSPCPYIINSNTTIGPVKVNCNLVIQDSAIVTLSGNVWVVGNLLIGSSTPIEKSATVKISQSIGSKSIAIIADNPSDRENSGTVSIKNSAIFEGSGSAGSYVVVISQNNKTGSDEAIEVKNSARGDLFVYASHGKVLIKNSAFINGAVGYEVEVKNSAHIDADADPVNIPSTGGSGGEFSLDSWLEI